MQTYQSETELIKVSDRLREIYKIKNKNAEELSKDLKREMHELEIKKDVLTHLVYPR